MSNERNPNKIYDLVTDRILAALDAGTVPWKKPWSNRVNGFTLAQHNAFSKRAYRGINVFILAAEGRRDPRWATYNQIKKNGGHVKRGSKGAIVVFWKFLEVEREDEDSGEKVAKTIPLLRYFRVFNVDDAEGLNLDAIAEPSDDDDFDPIAEAEAIAQGYLADGPSLTYDGGGGAFYQKSSDSIHLPDRDQFGDAQGFYDTLFHEIGHSTGHPDRLDRLTGDRFGSHGYGREELVAEFTSAFLCSRAGIDQEIHGNQAAYIASWKQTIKADARAVVVAAGQAQRAADLVLGEEPSTK